MKSLFKQIVMGLCCSLCAFSSLQGAGWSPIVTISDADTGANAQYTPSNSLLVTWTEIPSDDLRAAFLSPLGILSPSALVASNAVNPYSSVNPATGDAVVVWLDTNNNNVLASVYTAGTWGAPVTLDNAAGSFPNSIQVSFSPTGVAVACWITDDGMGSQTFRASTFSGTWTGPVTLAIPAGTSARGLAVPKNGAFAAAYWVDPASNFQVQRFSGGAWSSVHSELLTGINPDKGGPIVIDNSGFIALGFVYPDMMVSKNLVWATGQSAATHISNVDSTTPRLAVDNTGRAYAVWTTPNGIDPTNFVHASNFLFSSPLTGWSTDASFSAPNTRVVSLAADANGHLYVGLVDSTSNSTVIEATYTANTPPSMGSWAAPITVSDTTSFNRLSSGGVAVNPSGVSLISLISDDEAGNLALQEVHKTATGSFTSLFTITSVMADGSLVVSSVSNAGNKAIAMSTFSRQGGDSIRLTVFIDDVPPPVVGPNPPTNFIGQGGKNKFLTQTERFNGLTWTASTTPTVVNYLLFRNGQLIAVIPATGPLLYVDHNRDKHVTDTYTLYAVDASGAQSTPATVVVH